MSNYEKRSITFIPSLNSLLRFYKWKILQKIFWYSHARAFKTLINKTTRRTLFGKLANYLKKKVNLHDHGMFTAVVEVEGKIKSIIKFDGQKTYKS